MHTSIEAKDKIEIEKAKSSKVKAESKDKVEIEKAESSKVKAESKDKVMIEVDIETIAPVKIKKPPSTVLTLTAVTIIISSWNNTTLYFFSQSFLNF